MQFRLVPDGDVLLGSPANMRTIAEKGPRVLAETTLDNLRAMVK
jgi:hypothetical protein